MSNFELDVIKAIVEEFESLVEEGELTEGGQPYTFPAAVRDYYDNLADDLHDSEGDPEYQQGHREEMAVIERWFGAFAEFKPAESERIHGVEMECGECKHWPCICHLDD
jgi:hypothetical protein